MRNDEPLDIQSSEAKFNVKTNVGAMESTEQNVKFTDQNPAYHYSVDSEMDSTRGAADNDDATLGNFFSRPVKIANFEWTTSVQSFHEVFNPWSLYFNNPRILNRISNFNLLRCKLNVKILINGNGFHYGRLLAAYNPLHRTDDFTVTRAFFKQDLIQASQRPHVYLDPTTSQGGSLTLPFFWYKNALSIPAEDFNDMGEMVITEMVPLKHANGAEDRVTISIFAWAEDVNLSTPTSANPGGLVPQCDEQPLDPQMDEYERDGVISKPASVVSRIAGRLTSIPPIAPYAKATEMVASTVASVARLFGYSRPVTLADVVPYRPAIMGNMANANLADSSTKLALDAKQELTVDPRVTGVGPADELAIKAIACRESYLTQFPWSVDDNTEDALFYCDVSPALWDEVTYNAADGERKELHLPAMCFATLPFMHWRGTIKYRFQIVSSNFHKGRLKIVWDPYGFESNEYVTNYTHIVDIAEDKDFTVEIGWGSPWGYLAHYEPGVNSVPFGLGSSTATSNLFTNGRIQVYVVNELTVPNSVVDNDIMVNVFVSAGDDFEVANPDDDCLRNLTWFEKPDFPAPPLDTQSAESAIPQADTDSTTEPSAPMQSQVLNTMGTKTSLADPMTHVHYGEEVVSFRQCLKRYNFHSMVGWPKIDSSWFIHRRNNIPYHRGAAPGAVHDAAWGTNNYKYNYASMTLLNYLMPAFTGYRGGVRWKYLAFGGEGKRSDLLIAKRMSVSAQYLNGTYADALHTSETDIVRNGVIRLNHTWPGAHATATGPNPALEVEFPFYSNFRFGTCKEANLTTSLYNDWFHEILMNSDVPEGSSPNRLASFVSVGEDFNMYFFTGAPILRYEPFFPTPPPPLEDPSSPDMAQPGRPDRAGRPQYKSSRD